MVIKKTGKETNRTKNTVYVCDKCGFKLKVDESSCYYSGREIKNILCCGQTMRPLKSIVNQSGDA